MTHSEEQEISSVFTCRRALDNLGDLAYMHIHLTAFVKGSEML